MSIKCSRLNWLSSAVVFFRYLYNVVLPTNLLPWYEVALHDSLRDPTVLLSLIGLLAIAVATIWLIYTRRREGFWILWFGITLLPMLNVVVPFRSLMQDRYLYLALVGPLARARAVSHGE